MGRLNDLELAEGNYNREMVRLERIFDLNCIRVREVGSKTKV